MTGPVSLDVEPSGPAPNPAVAPAPSGGLFAYVAREPDVDAYTTTVTYPEWATIRASTTIIAPETVQFTIDATAVWQSWQTIANSNTTLHGLRGQMHWGGNGAYWEVATNEARNVTPEQAAANMETWRRQEEERQTRRAAARARAERLLEEVLTEEQVRQQRTYGHFELTAPSGIRYRVYTDGHVHGNVKELDAAGNEVASLCCAPSGNIPAHDGFAGQKLFLEHDEVTFRRVANITDLRTGQIRHGRAA